MRHVQVWCECYANLCFAEKMLNMLDVKAKLVHNEKLGRDRILGKGC